MTNATTLLDLIMTARTNETKIARHYFAGTNKWLEINESRGRRQYVYGSSFVEVDYLTRKGAANVFRAHRAL